MTDHSFWKMRQAVQFRKDNKDYENYSKERLFQIIETKLKTSFIGAISQIEQEFGELWGFGERKKLDEDELYWKSVFEKVRNKILNNGNNQIRAINNELDQYEVKWNRNYREIPVKPEENTNE